jgi:hypothetical protein
LLVVAGVLASVEDSVIQALQTVEYVVDQRSLLRRERFQRGARVIAKSPLLGSFEGSVMNANANIAILRLANGMTVTVPTLLVQSM